jgi:glucose/arabinose dehydrogenase
VKHFDAGLAQLLTNPRGKLHRINSDGTITTDNPFGANVNSVWAVWNHRA